MATASTDATTIEKQTKVAKKQICIHVLREGRTDFRLMRSATALVEAGFAVSLVDIEEPRTCPLHEDLQGVTMEHIIVPTWHTSRRFEAWFLLVAIVTFIRSVVRLMQTRADIYHASELTALPASFLAAFLRRKKLVFEIYDLQFPKPLTYIGFWRRIGSLFYDLFLPRCAGVIVTSPYHGSEVQKRYHVTQMALVRNVPVYRNIEKTTTLHDYLHLEPQVRIALYQGNIQPDRELEQLVYAGKFLAADTIIVMMGKTKGFGGLAQRLQDLIIQEGVQDRVKLIPPAPYTELLKWTASADIGMTLFSPQFSLSVRYELPNKFFEYLMAGLPVLSTRLEAIAEVIETYHVGTILNSLEPAEIAATINTMLAGKQSLSVMSANAKTITREQFNWDQEKTHLIEFYESMLLSPHR